MKKYQSSNTRKIYELDFSSKRNICPECSTDRKKKTSKDLQYFVDKDTAYCFHCNTTFYVFNPYEKKEYKKPEWKNKTELTDKAVKWFESRGIKQQTLNKLKIYSDVEYMPQFAKDTEVICFPYFRENELINIKYRGAKKSFKLVSNAELLFWNYDVILKNKEVIICEGEMDLLSWYEAGFENVISVPNGANKQLDYINEDLLKLFDSIDVIYLSCDNDTKGIELREELIRRFGIEKCFIVDFKGHKDCNDFLLNLGVNELKLAKENAKQKKYEGVIEIDTLYNDLKNYFEQGEKRGLLLNQNSIDEFITWETSRLAVVTGVPGSGKSEFVDYVLTKLNLIHGWKSVYFTPENYPLKYHYEKLHEKFIGKKFTKDISSELEFDMGFDYIKNNFFYIMPQEETTINYILERTKFLIKTQGIKCLVIDPFNKLEHDISNGQSETNYISKFLDKLTHFGKLNDILIILVAHPRKIQRGEIPTLYDINGSANFYNKCDYGFTVHRKRNEDGAMNNEVEVHWQKIKFKNLGKQGVTTFMYNYNNGRFEDIKVEGVRGWDNSNWLKVDTEIIQNSVEKEFNINEIVCDF